MGLETGVNFIDDLVATNPLAGDDPSEGDDHLRAIKTAVQGSFTSLGSAAVTTTAAELNQLDAVTVGGTSSGDIADIDSAQDFSNKTVNGGTAVGLVMLDTVTNLVSGSVTEDTWTSYSGSALSALGARFAILYIEADIVASSITFTRVELHARKGGSSVVDRLVGIQQVVGASTEVRDAIHGVECLVELDASGHFDYKFEGGVSGGSGSMVINVNGYYV